MNEAFVSDIALRGLIDEIMEEIIKEIYEHEEEVRSGDDDYILINDSALFDNSIRVLVLQFHKILHSSPPDRWRVLAQSAPIVFLMKYFDGNIPYGVPRKSDAWKNDMQKYLKAIVNSKRCVGQIRF
jgi:hypothetical protein